MRFVRSFVYLIVKEDVKNVYYLSRLILLIVWDKMKFIWGS